MTNTKLVMMIDTKALNNQIGIMSVARMFEFIILTFPLI